MLTHFFIIEAGIPTQPIPGETPRPLVPPSDLPPPLPEAPEPDIDEPPQDPPIPVREPPYPRPVQALGERTAT